MTYQLPLEFTINELRTPSGVMGSLGLLVFAWVSHHQANIPHDLGVAVGHYDRCGYKVSRRGPRPEVRLITSAAAALMLKLLLFLPLLLLARSARLHCATDADDTCLAAASPGVAAADSCQLRPRLRSSHASVPHGVA